MGLPDAVTSDRNRVAMSVEAPEPRATARVTGRDEGLDALRAIACLLVFLHHGDWFLGLAGGWLHGGAPAGVYTFFLLSGFLLYRPFLRGPVSLRSYATKRAARIYPAYLLALIGLSILDRDLTFAQHPLHYLLFVQNTDPSLFQGFVGVTWTLEMEVGFYLALPLLAIAVGGRPRRLVALMLPSLVGWLVVQTFIGTTPNVTLFPLYGWMFGAGMLLAIAVERGWRPTTHATLLAGTALVVIAMLVARPLGQADGALEYAITVGLVEAGAALVATWLLVHRLPPRLAVLASIAGAMSYAFYLWHLDVIGWVATLGLHPAIATAAALVITLPFAALSWLLVEKPAIHWAGRVAAPRSTTPSGVHHPAWFVGPAPEALGSD